MTFDKCEYVLVKPNGWFYQENRDDSIPTIIYDNFCNDLLFATKYDTYEEAMTAKQKITDRLYESDGNTNVPKDYLRIGKIQVTII